MANEKTVQVHVPYPYLMEKSERLIEAGINPEIYMDGFFIEEAVPSDLERIRDSFGASERSDRSTWVLSIAAPIR